MLASLDDISPPRHDGREQGNKAEAVLRGRDPHVSRAQPRMLLPFYALGPRGLGARHDKSQRGAIARAGLRVGWERRAKNSIFHPWKERRTRRGVCSSPFNAKSRLLRNLAEASAAR